MSCITLSHHSCGHRTAAHLPASPIGIPLLSWTATRKDMMSARQDIMTSLTYQSGLGLLRFTAMLLGLLLPLAVPTVVESVLTISSETEGEWEDVTECTTQVETRHLRKRRAFAPVWQGPRTAAVRRAIATSWRFGGHATSGHRLQNGQLAPMRC